MDVIGVANSQGMDGAAFVRPPFAKPTGWQPCGIIVDA
jgi:hypothetical protein